MTRRFLLFIWTVFCTYSILTEAQNTTLTPLIGNTSTTTSNTTLNITQSTIASYNSTFIPSPSTTNNNIISTTSPTTNISTTTTSTITSNTNSSITTSTISSASSTLTSSSSTAANTATSTTSPTNINSTTTTSITTTNAPTTITTVDPPRPGEYTVKAEMAVTFGTSVFIPQYNDKSSTDYKSFTNDIFTKMRTALTNLNIRLIEIIFNSIRSGSVIVDMQVVTASNTSLNDTAASNSLQSAVSNAYGANATSTVNITQSSSAVTTPASTTSTPGPSTAANNATFTTSPTNINSTTTTSTTTTNAPTTITTVDPPRAGEYTVKAKMAVTFGTSVFISQYNDKTSTEYKSFTNDIRDRMRKELLKLLIRLIEIIFDSIRSGSVIVDMQVVTASNTSQSDTAASSSLQSAVSNAYGANATSTVNITQSSSIVTDAPTVPTRAKSTGSTIMFSLISVINIGFSFLMMEIGK